MSRWQPEISSLVWNRSVSAYTVVCTGDVSSTLVRKAIRDERCSATISAWSGWQHERMLYLQAGSRSMLSTPYSHTSKRFETSNSSICFVGHVKSLSQSAICLILFTNECV
eukprot:3957929-Amphidinium_carterae.1